MDKSEIKGLATVLAIVLTIVFGSNMHRIHELNKELNLEKVNVSKLEEEVRSLQSDVHELESENDELKSVINNLNNENYNLLEDAHLMWKAEDNIYSVFEDRKYYHRLFFCSKDEEQIVEVYLIDDALKLDYSPCPECFKKIYGKLEAD